MLKSLIVRTLLVFLISIGLVEGTILLNPFRTFDNQNDFAAAIIDKQAMLKNTPSPKIVIVGGSSVAYGVNTKLIQDSLGIPVLNMSFQYFLGSDFLIKQVTENLNKGDILITSFEYISSVNGDKKEQFRAASYYPKSLKWIVYKDITDIISGFLRFRIDKFRSIVFRLFNPIKESPSVNDKENIFFRSAINSNGDLISHLNNPNVDFTSGIINQDSTYLELLPNLNAHNEILFKKGVKVLFSYPPLDEESAALDALALEKIKNEFSNKLDYETLEDSPFENTFPKDYFLDMCFHLNAGGREVRTQKLIQQLKKYQSGQ